PPTKFIPLAEELGLISLVGTWVLERGCQQMVDWKHHDPVPWHMGINVSAPQIMKNGFAVSVLKILEAYEIDPEKLQLEVTESMLLSDLDSVAGNFRLLRSHGVRIALDDFGTGYSSLTYLQELPVDILKIDRSFISNLAPGAAMESLASTIVLLANRFGLETVAEGVETVEQLELVRLLNCDLVQGYYFSKPVTAVDLPGVIASINQEQSLPQKAA
ncbi:EAL domain-containing protein, partial [Granulosicoccus sp.]